jgi:transposase-like protein
MPRRHPPEFRHRVLELVEAGTRVTEVAGELEVSSQAIYDWRRQAAIDDGLRPGVSSTENAELVATCRRLAPA